MRIDDSSSRIICVTVSHSCINFIKGSSQATAAFDWWWRWQWVLHKHRPSLLLPHLIESTDQSDQERQQVRKVFFWLLFFALKLDSANLWKGPVKEEHQLLFTISLYHRLALVSWNVDLKCRRWFSARCELRITPGPSVPADGRGEKVPGSSPDHQSVHNPRQLNRYISRTIF